MPFGKSSLAGLFAIFQLPASKPWQANCTSASNTLTTVTAEAAPPECLRRRKVTLARLSTSSGPHESNQVEPNRTQKLNFVHQKSGQIGKETVNFSKPT